MVVLLLFINKYSILYIKIQVVKINKGENMKRTNDVSLGAVHTHTHKVF